MRRRHFIGDDLSRPNEAYWQHIDFIIQAAWDRNMAVMFNPIWIRHHRERVDASGRHGCRDYGAWLAGRFHRFENVMYFIGGGHPPRDEIDELDAMARAIKSVAPHALLTYRVEHGNGLTWQDTLDYFSWYDCRWMLEFINGFEFRNRKLAQGRSTAVSISRRQRPRLFLRFWHSRRRARPIRGPEATHRHRGKTTLRSTLSPVSSE